MARAAFPARAALAALILSLGAGAVQAQATPDQVDKLVQAIVAAGCVVTADNNAEILAAAGLNQESASVVVNALLGLGQAEIVGGDLRLKTEECN